MESVCSVFYAVSIIHEQILLQKLKSFLMSNLLIFFGPPALAGMVL